MKSKTISALPSERSAEKNDSSTLASSDLLAEKHKTLDGLVTVIEIYRGRMLSAAQKEKIDAYEYGLSADLKTLMERYRLEEIDIKIDSMRKVIKLIKGQ